MGGPHAVRGAEAARIPNGSGKRIRAANAEHGLDAVFTYCFSYDLILDVVRDTIKLGIPWINFFCDSTHMFERVEPIARLISLNWFPESAAEPRYRAWVCRTCWRLTPGIPIGCRTWSIAKHCARRPSLACRPPIASRRLAG